MSSSPRSGSCGGCLRGRLTSYASTVVDAPADVVWNTVIDIDANPSNISSVQSVERLDGSNKGDKVEAGTRWKETRVCPLDDTLVAQTKTVVFVGTHGGRCCHQEEQEVDGKENGYDSDSGEQFFYKGGSAPRECPQHPSWPRSFSLAISYEKPYDGVCNTSTLTVQPYHEDSTDPVSPIKHKQRTLLSGTFAAVPARLRDKILFSLTWCCSIRETSKSFQEELDELASTAKRADATAGVAHKMTDEADGPRADLPTSPPLASSPQA